MKIALIGADGQLGTDIQKVISKNELIPLTINDIDISDQEKTNKVIKKIAPDAIINTAAFHRVDDCETEEMFAYGVNAIGVKNLAIACREADCELLHISTDYVFDGKKNKPYVETDCPNPQSVYGISKLAGEQVIKYILDKYYIVRGSGLYGTRGCMATGGKNFIELMLHLAKEKGKVKVVTDQTISPTYTMDMAEKISELIRTKKYGIYHMTNSGECSWYEFAKKAFELTNTKVKLEKTTSVEFKTKAKRPAYSVLDNFNLRNIGIKDMRSWDKALEAYIKEREQPLKH